MSRRLPPMVVTVEIRGGPTVRLDYDPARGHGDVIACTRITERSEIPPSAQRWLVVSSGRRLRATVYLCCLPAGVAGRPGTGCGTASGSTGMRPELAAIV